MPTAVKTNLDLSHVIQRTQNDKVNIISANKQNACRHSVIDNVAFVDREK